MPVFNPPIALCSLPIPWPRRCALALCAALCMLLALPWGPAHATVQGEAAAPVITAANVGRLVARGALGLGLPERVTLQGSALLVRSRDYVGLLNLADPAAEPTLLGTPEAHITGFLSTDGRLFTRADGSKDLTVSDARTGQQIRTIDLSSTQSQVPYWIQVSDDGQLLFGRYELDGCVIWDLEAGKRLWNDKTCSATVIGFYGSAPLLLTLDRGEARVYDAKTGKRLLQKRSANGQFINFAVISDDGARLATATGFTLEVTDLKGGRVQRFKVVADTYPRVVYYYESVSDLQFSPDGSTLASLTYGGSIQLWNLKTGRALPSPPAPAAISMPFAFNTAGNRIRYTIEAGRALGEWDWATKTEKTLAPDSLPIAFVQGRIVTTSGETITLREDDSTPIQSFAFPGGGVSAAWLSPDGAHLAAFGLGTLRAFGVKTGKEVLSVPRFYANINPDTAPVSSSIVTTGNLTDALLSVDVVTGKVARSLYPWSGDILAPYTSSFHRLSPDGKRALLIQNLYRNRKWSVLLYLVDLTGNSPARNILTLPYEASIRAVNWGKTLAEMSIVAYVSDNLGSALERIELSSGEVSAKIPIEGDSWATNADLTRLYRASVSGTIMTVDAWNLSTGENLGILGSVNNWFGAGRLADIALNQDGSALATDFAGALTLWDARALKPIATLDPARTTTRLPERSTTMAFDPTGKWLFRYLGGTSVSLPHSVTWWDSATGKQLGQVYYSPKAVGYDGGAEVTAAPDGRTFVILDQAVNALTLVEARTGARLIDSVAKPITPDKVIVRGAAYNPSADLLVTIDEDGSLSLFDTRTGALLRTIARQVPGPHSVKFSGDGRYIIADFGRMVFSVGG